MDTKVTEMMNARLYAIKDGLAKAHKCAGLDTSLTYIETLFMDVKRLKDATSGQPRHVAHAINFLYNRLTGISHSASNGLIDRRTYRNYVNECIDVLQFVTPPKVKEVKEAAAKVRQTTVTSFAELAQFNIGNESETEQEQEPEVAPVVENLNFEDKRLMALRRRFPVSTAVTFRLITAHVMPFNTFYSKSQRFQLHQIGTRMTPIDDYFIFNRQKIMVVNLDLFEKKWGKASGDKLISIVDKALTFIGNETGNRLAIVSSKYNPCPKNSRLLCFWVASITDQEILRYYQKWGFVF